MTAEIAAGLCSVTFRALRADDVVDLASAAGLAAIEWGADVHAPPGDLAEASRLRKRCEVVGVRCASYGSYYFAGESPESDLDPLIATARELGARTIRVWAPGNPRPDRWAESAPVVEALQRACDRADDLTIAVEFHPGTLTETARSTRELLADVHRPNLRTYWQPVPGATHVHALTELDPIIDHLAHLHVFSWNADSSRLALDTHATLWRKALGLVADRADDFPRVAYLEFVAGDASVAFERDASTLRAWLDQLP